MEATIQLPDVLVRRLERLAAEEGTSLAGIIERLVTEQTEQRQAISDRRQETRFPLILKRETGIISPVTGADLDEMFAREDLPS